MNLAKRSIFFLWLAHHSMLATCVWQEYCRAWVSELSFARVSESTTGYTLTSVQDLSFTLAKTQDRRDHRLLESLPKDTGKVK